MKNNDINYNKLLIKFKLNKNNIYKMEKNKIDLKKIPNNINKENNSLSDDESDDDKYNKSFFHIFNIHIKYYKFIFKKIIIFNFDI